MWYASAAAVADAQEGCKQSYTEAYAGNIFNSCLLSCVHSNMHLCLLLTGVQEWSMQGDEVCECKAMQI